jgi:glutaredoxin
MIAAFPSFILRSSAPRRWRGIQSCATLISEQESGRMPEDASLTLYQTVFCPYCERVRGALRRLGVSISLRGIDERMEWRRELQQATGRQTVPCLRVEAEDGSVEWIHESEEIIDFLERRFGG